jgi:regulator of RNase E activity RraA
MSTRAKYLGAQGVVIDGNFRDINEHREMRFPVGLHTLLRPAAMR